MHIKLLYKIFKILFLTANAKYYHLCVSVLMDMFTLIIDLRQPASHPKYPNHPFVPLTVLKPSTDKKTDYRDAVKQFCQLTYPQKVGKVGQVGNDGSQGKQEINSEYSTHRKYGNKFNHKDVRDTGKHSRYNTLRSSCKLPVI